MLPVIAHGSPDFRRLSFMRDAARQSISNAVLIASPVLRQTTIRNLSSRQQDPLMKIAVVGLGFRLANVIASFRKVCPISK